MHIASLSRARAQHRNTYTKELNEWLRKYCDSDGANDALRCSCSLMRICVYACIKMRALLTWPLSRSCSFSLSLTFLSFLSGRPLFCDKIASAFRLYTVKPILRSASNTCFLLSALHSIAERLVRTSRTRSVTSDIFYISVCILVLCYRSAISIKINGLHFASKFLVI